MAEQDRLDTESMPMTERYTPTFDTGVHPKAEPELIEPEPPAGDAGGGVGDRTRSHGGAGRVAVTDDVPAVYLYHYLKWWQFILVLLAVWVPAAGSVPACSMVEPRQLQKQDRGGLRRPGLRRRIHRRRIDIWRWCPTDHWCRRWPSR